MKAPDLFVERAQALGFSIQGWDETQGSLAGYGQTFIGSHAEVRAYLEAWKACSETTQFAASKKDPGVPCSILMMRSDFVVDHDGKSGNRMVSINSSDPLSRSGYQAATVVRFPVFTPFRGERIAIPDSIASSFMICGVSVGNRRQTPGTMDAIDGSLFAARIDNQAKLLMRESSTNVIAVTVTEPALAEFGRAFTMDVAQSAMDVTLYVALKPEAKPCVFEAMVLGRTVQS